MVTPEPVTRGHRYADKAKDVLSNPVGQIFSQMNEVRPVRAVIYRLVQEHLEAVDRLRKPTPAET